METARNFPDFEVVARFVNSRVFSGNITPEDEGIARYTLLDLISPIPVGFELPESDNYRLEIASRVAASLGFELVPVSAGGEA